MFNYIAYIYPLKATGKERVETIVRLMLDVAEMSYDKGA